MAAVLGLAGTAAVAEQGSVSGDVAVYYGSLGINDDSGVWPAYEFDGGSVTGAAGRISYGFSPSLSAQLDLSTERVNVDPVPGWIDDYTVSDIAAHMLFDVGGATIGAMASTGKNEAYPYSPSDSYRTLALEGAFDAGKVTLTAQAGKTVNADDNDIAATYIRLGGRVMVADNISAGASLGGGTFDYEPGAPKIDFRTMGLDAEYSFPHAPYSAFVAIQRSKQEETDEGGEGWTDTIVAIGVRMTFGDGPAPVMANYNPVTGVEHLRGGDWE